MNNFDSHFAGKTALVTGGAGFIGSHLCEALIQAGCHVVSVDDYSAGKEHNLVSLTGSDSLTVIKADICDVKAMEEIFTMGLDYVFHNAASKKNICLRDPMRDLMVNAGGTLLLLQLAVKYRIKKFLHASTGSVYGEPQFFPTEEEHSLNPVSYYGVSKLAGEKYVQAFHHLYELNTTVLRYFHVYGPRQESNQYGGVVSIFLRKILAKQDLTIFGDGSQMRSFTWVKDIVRANMLCAVSDRSVGEVYNCASGIQITIKELAEGMLQMTGADKSLRIVYQDWLPGDIVYFNVSNKKIADHVGIDFEKDFWGNMSRTLDDFVSYLQQCVLTSEA